MKRKINIFIKIGINIVYNVLKTYWTVFNIKTTGVKPLIIKNNEVLLVKHSYGEKLWKLSGGGIKKNEEIESVAMRELKEELGLGVHSIEYNLGKYISFCENRHDTIFVPIVTDWTWENKKLSIEIQEAKFFNINNLPDDIESGVKRRIVEYREGRRDIKDAKW